MRPYAGCFGLASGLVTLLGTVIGMLWVDLQDLKAKNILLEDGISLIQQQLVQQNLESRTMIQKLDIALDAFKSQVGRR